MPDFWIKKDATERPYETQLTDENGDAVNLTSVSSIDFKMKPFGDDTVKVNDSAIISDPENGVIEYQWSTGDTDTAGRFSAEWVVTYAGGGVEVFPSSTVDVVRIYEDVA